MWTLVASKATTIPGSTDFNLPYEGVAHIVKGVHGSQVGVIRKLYPNLDPELGRISVGPFGVKVEAVADTLIIVPGAVHTGTSGPPTGEYKLQPPVGGHSEAIFLRHGDVLKFPSLDTSFTCEWSESEVQVNSSAADVFQRAHGAGTKRVAKTPEGHPEDEDLDNHTATRAPSHQEKIHPRATPQLPEQRSIVQETPTAPRVNGAFEYPDTGPPDFTNQVTGPVNQTPSPSQDGPLARVQNLPQNASDSLELDGAATGLEKQSSESPSHHKRKPRSPRVQISSRTSRKREAAAIDEDTESEHEAPAGPYKRARTSDDDTQNSHLSNANVKKSKKSSVKEASIEPDDMVSTRSQKSSQRSTTIAAEAYDGAALRLACSNSTITKASHAVKFLKKKGGVYVEDLGDEFNVLCVRDGGLQKKPKVLYAIARGIPIVTDKWLLESAKAGHFLSVSAFKPSALKQEKEWNFSLDDVFGQPQTPFEGYNIHFTKSLKATFESFSEIETVCKAAGAKNVTNTRANKIGNSIVLANNFDEDPDAQKLVKEGVTCYTKDLLIYSILRGALNLDNNDFQITEIGTTKTPLKEKEKKKRGRKST